MGPDIDLWSCHEADNADYTHQQFGYDATTKQLRALHAGQGADLSCLTLDRTQPAPPGTAPPWHGGYKRRVADMLRLLKSAGVNAVSIEDVNACGKDTRSLETDSLRNITNNLAPIFRRFAITPFLSVCYGAPLVISNVTTDPTSPLAQRWWADKAAELWHHWPDFGGFLVKADSEGNQGPQAYNRSEADGANLLARAVAPHNGTLIWRAFVYGGNSDVGREELARQSYDTFMPLDGLFDSNVILQIKNGPMDFQVGICDGNDGMWWGVV